MLLNAIKTKQLNDRRMKLLITGINGFVAQHFLRFLTLNDKSFTILGISRSKQMIDPDSFPELNLTIQQADLLDKSKVGEIIKNFRPDFLLHLASVSSVGHSWLQPLESFVNNTNIFLNLVEQLRIENIPCRILSIGSSEEYGIVTTDDIPITEKCKLNPISPYAVARVSQEMISEIYHKGYGMDIVMTRSFNHIGPGQKDVFVISSFAKQLAKIYLFPDLEKKVVVGDNSIIRDFIDVRDVVKAYYLLLKNGVSGEIYNICSGNGISIKDVLEKMRKLIGIEITIEENKKLFRKNDNPVIIGNADKIKNSLKWAPNIDIDQSLTDIIDWWKIQLKTI
ncbi:MAG: NAD-dependent epimerase/dehydratase family protein [Ferruginibacter sp.]|nr:NAD-dependent epimerase/dehydratase family protein [Ferruginibacter sp.]